MATKVISSGCSEVGFIVRTKGAWDKKDILKFSEEGTSSVIMEKGMVTIPVDKIDNVIEDRVDFIKMDIEGAEMNALIGAEKCLINCRPQLATSIYHSNNDMQDIPLYLHTILKDYVFKIGQYSPDNDETILYAIPKELYIKRD